MQTSWGALWPPLHPVHGGEGFDGESELSDGTFLKRKREDSKEKTRARGNPYAKSAVSDRTRECRKRSEPLTVVNRGLGEYLGTRERGGGSMDARWTRQARDALATRAPYTIQEYAMPTSLLSRFDKCFAAAWLDHDRVLLGTKDNKLASLNIDTGECNEVPLPSRLRFERMELTEASERADGDWISEPSTSRNASPSYAIGQDPGFAPFGRGEVRNVAFPPTPDLVDGASIYENCGIHAIAINPSGTRMVTGGANPSDAAVFSVPDLRPTALLTSHTDWVFGLDWITDNLVASGSRDKTVKIFSVPDAASRGSTYRQLSVPVATLGVHRDRVRDVKYCHGIKRLASMSTDGCVIFTVPETMSAVEQTKICSRRELVCLATDGNILAAGSQEHVSFLDNRARGVVRDERLVGNSNDGVRSLSFTGGGRLLTCGGGAGAITFFDVRAGKFLPGERGDNVLDNAPAYDTCLSLGSSRDSTPHASPRRSGASSPDRISDPGFDESQGEPLTLEAGEGWLDREHHIYLDHFTPGLGVFNACYTHAWDPAGARLLVAGGPLAYGLKGCYVGVWR